MRSDPLIHAGAVRRTADTRRKGSKAKWTLPYTKRCWLSWSCWSAPLWWSSGSSAKTAKNAD